jgi:hypothetical protein
MASTSRVSPSDRAFLEVTLQDVTARESIFAQMTLVGALARVCGTSDTGHCIGNEKLTSKKMAF